MWIRTPWSDRVDCERTCAREGCTNFGRHSGSGSSSPKRTAARRRMESAPAPRRGPHSRRVARAGGASAHLELQAVLPSFGDPILFTLWIAMRSGILREYGLYLPAINGTLLGLDPKT